MEEIKMGKVMTSKKQKKSEKQSLIAHEPFSSAELKDPQLVINILLESIKEGDLETFREVLVAHLLTVNKSQIAKKAGIGRRTLYDLMDPSRNFNPELSTVSAIIKAIAS
jgi:DNA-binding phage protein